jgi:hypothetical protein
MRIRKNYNLCDCGREKAIVSRSCKYCSYIRRRSSAGIRMINGYINVYMPDHHRAVSIGYVPLHTLLIEKKIQRPLRNNECCHHINGQKDDNRFENLMLISIKEHGYIHAKKGRNKMCYGKYLQHKHDYCHCGNLKDVRSKMCRKCWCKEGDKKTLYYDDIGPSSQSEKGQRQTT